MAAIGWLYLAVYEALDKGIVRCAHPARTQRICHSLSAAKIPRFIRQWHHLSPIVPGTGDRMPGLASGD